MPRTYFDRFSDSEHRLERVIIIIALCALVIWVFADVRRRGRLDESRPEVHRTDLTAYTAAGDVWWNGGTSEEAFAASSPRGWRYQYLPFFGTLMGPLSQLGTTTQSFLFGMFSLGVLFGIYYETRCLLRLYISPRISWDRSHICSGLDPPIYITVLAAVAFALPCLNTIQRGQVGLLVVYPLMLGFRLVWTRCAIGGGISLAFPAVLKILPTLSGGSILLNSVLPLFRRDARRDRTVVMRAIKSCVGFALGVLIFLLIIPALLIGWQNNLDGIHHFLTNVVMNPDFARDWGFDIHSIRNQSLAGASWQLTDTIQGGLGTAHNAEVDGVHPFDTGSIAGVVSVLRWLILAFFLATLVRISTARNTWNRPEAAAVVFGLSCVATLVFSPVSWGHHFVQALPGFIAIPAWLHLRGYGRGAFLMSLTPAVLILAHYIALPIAGPLGILGFGITGWLLTSCVLCLRTVPTQSS